MNRNLKSKLSLILCLVMIMTMPGISSLLPEALGGAVLTHAYMGYDSSGSYSGYSGSESYSGYSGSGGGYPGETSYYLEQREIGALSYIVLDGSLVINGTGEIPADAFCNREDIVKVEIRGNVTGIGSSAFAGCVNLTQIYLNDTVEVIGDSAFAGCEKLQYVGNTEKLTKVEGRAFEACKSIRSIDLNNIISISDYAFIDCTQLNTVRIGNANTIGKYSFAQCTSLTTIEYPCDCTAISSLADSVDASVLKMYHSGKYITEVTSSTHTCSHCDEVLEHKWAGNHCDECKLVLMGRVSSADGEAYNKDITWAYYWNDDANAPYNLKITGVGKLRDYSTYSVPWIATAQGASEEDIDRAGLSVGHSGLCDSNGYLISYKIRDIEIGEGITDLGAHGLPYNYFCSSLKLPSTLKRIGKSAIEIGNGLLKKVVIPASVEELAAEALSYQRYEQLIFEDGSKLATIGEKALYYCADKVVFSGNIPPVNASNDLFGTADPKVYYPDTEEWNEFVSKDTSAYTEWIPYDKDFSNCIEMSATETGVEWTKFDLNESWLKFTISEAGLYNLTFSVFLSENVFDYEMFDSNLKTICEQRVDSDSIKVLDLAAGTYYVRLKNANENICYMSVEVTPHEHSYSGICADIDYDETYHCARCACGEMMHLYQHIFVNGKCIYCSQCVGDIVDKYDFVYDYNDNNHIAYCKYCKEYLEERTHSMNTKGCDAKCFTCGYIRTGDGAHYFDNNRCLVCGELDGIDVNGHCIAFDYIESKYLCLHDGCDFTLEAGYYDSELQPVAEDRLEEDLVYALLGNVEYGSNLDYSSYSKMKVLDLRNLKRCNRLLVNSVSNSELQYADLRMLCEYCYLPFEFSWNDNTKVKLPVVHNSGLSSSGGKIVYMPHIMMSSSDSHYCNICNQYHEPEMVDGKCSNCGIIDLSMAEVELLDAIDGNKYKYTGEDFTPRVKVTFDGEELIENYNYYIYKCEISNVGTYELTVHSKIDTLSEKKVEFEVIRGVPDVTDVIKEFTTNCLASTNDLRLNLETYNIILDEATELSPGENIVTCIYNPDPSRYEDAEIEVKINLVHDYSSEGDIHYCYNCEIRDAHNLVDGVCTVCGAKDIVDEIEIIYNDTADGNKYNYDESSGVDLNITIKYNGEELTNGPDYYLDNVYGYLPGKYSTIVSFAGEYCGTTTVQWEILRAQPNTDNCIKEFSFRCNEKDTILGYLAAIGYNIDPDTVFETGDNYITCIYNIDPEFFADVELQIKVDINHNFYSFGDIHYCMYCYATEQHNIVDGYCTVCDAKDISNDIEVILNGTEDGNKYSFSGVPVTLDVTVLYQGNEIGFTLGGDYCAIEPGKYEATIEFDNTFCGSVTVEWEIYKLLANPDEYTSEFKFKCYEADSIIDTLAEAGYIVDPNTVFSSNKDEVNYISCILNPNPNFYDDVETVIAVTVEHNFTVKSEGHYCSDCNIIDEHILVDGVCIACGGQYVADIAQITLDDAIDGNKYYYTEEIICPIVSVVGNSGEELNYNVTYPEDSLLPGKYELSVSVEGYCGVVNVEWEIIKSPAHFDGSCEIVIECISKDIFLYDLISGYFRFKDAEIPELNIGENFITLIYNPDPNVFEDTDVELYILVAEHQYQCADGGLHYCIYGCVDAEGKHIFENNVCEVCGYEVVIPDDIKVINLPCNSNILDLYEILGSDFKFDEEFTGLAVGENIVPVTYHYATDASIDIEIVVNWTEHSFVDGFCNECGAKRLNGLVYDTEYGLWLYYTEGNIDTTFMGFTYYNNNWWFVREGILDASYKGIVEFVDDLVCVENGLIAKNKNGLYNDYGNYYWLKDGYVDKSFTGIKRVDNEFAYFVKGVNDCTLECLVQNNGDWWYVRNGVVDTDYTGFYENAAGNWYVQAGKIAVNFTGLVYVDGKWWSVHNGRHYSDFTGMIKNADIWWYVVNGVLASDYNGILTNDGGTWLIKTGRLVVSSGIFTADGKFYYVINGKVAVNYTGLVANAGSSWYIENGIINTNYTGTFTDANGTWKIVKGKLVE